MVSQIIEKVISHSAMRKGGQLFLKDLKGLFWCFAWTMLQQDTPSIGNIAHRMGQINFSKGRVASVIQDTDLDPGRTSPKSYCFHKMEKENIENRQSPGYRLSAQGCCIL